MKTESDGRSGHIRAETKFANLADEALSTRVRSVSLSEVFVDTSVQLLFLPCSMIGELGLRPIEDVDVRTKDGLLHTRLFEEVRLRIAGRAALVQCVELPEITEPIIGRLPLLELGLDPVFEETRFDTKEVWLRA